MTVRDLLARWGTPQQRIDDLRALSLIQPWASLMALGEKCIETRSWPASHRGPVVIHASGRPGGRWNDDGLEFAAYDPDARAAWARHPKYFPTRKLSDIPLGALLAVTLQVECRPGPELHRLLVDAERRSEHAVIPVRPSLFGERYEVRCGRSERAFGFYDAPGRWGFLTVETHRLVTPIVTKGNRSFWRIPEDVRAQLLDAEVVPA